MPTRFPSLILTLAPTNYQDMETATVAVISWGIYVIAHATSVSD